MDKISEKINQINDTINLLKRALTSLEEKQYKKQLENGDLSEKQEYYKHKIGYLKFNCKNLELKQMNIKKLIYFIFNTIIALLLFLLIDNALTALIITSIYLLVSSSVSSVLFIDNEKYFIKGISDKLNDFENKIKIYELKIDNIKKKQSIIESEIEQLEISKLKINERIDLLKKEVHKYKNIRSNVIREYLGHNEELEQLLDNELNKRKSLLIN